MKFQPTPDIFLQTLSNEQQEKSEIRQGLQACVNNSQLYDLSERLHYYITTSQDVLGLLYDITANSDSKCSTHIVQHLYEFLQNPNDLFPESKYGAWGLIDDAWMIHNTAYRLFEAGILSIALFPFAWDKIAAADHVVIRCLPPEVSHRLEALLLQFMQMIALEVHDYHPHCSYRQDDYHPYMGEGRALGIQIEALDCCTAINPPIDWFRK